MNQGYRKEICQKTIAFINLNSTYDEAYIQINLEKKTKKMRRKYLSFFLKTTSKAKQYLDQNPGKEIFGKKQQMPVTYCKIKKK